MTYESDDPLEDDLTGDFEFPGVILRVSDEKTRVPVNGRMKNVGLGWAFVKWTQKRGGGEESWVGMVPSFYRTKRPGSWWFVETDPEPEGGSSDESSDEDEGEGAILDSDSDSEL